MQSMAEIERVTVATTNKGKLAEAQAILGGIEVSGVKLDINEIQTLDPIKCAEEKAKAAFALIGTPVIVDDTILPIEALKGLPGTYIDAFMDTLGNEGIVDLLKGVTDRRAYAQTTLVYYDGKRFVHGIGRINGEISEEVLDGGQGFGWDPIFRPNGSGKTFAQMTPEEKNAVSMRKLAWEDLKGKLFKF